MSRVEKHWWVVQKSSDLLSSLGWRFLPISPVEKTKTYLEIFGDIPEDMLTTSLGLSVQYDPTCSVLHLWKQNLLPGNQVFYYSSVCRGSDVGYQIGIELIGHSFPDGEIEVITTLLSLLENLGIKEWRVVVAPPGYENVMITPDKLSSKWINRLSPLIAVLGEKIVVGGIFPKTMRYYKDFRFLIYAEGSGLPVGGGGRYDQAVDGLVGVGGYLDVDKLGGILCLP